MTFAVSSTCELKNKTIKLFDMGPRKEECGRRVSVVGEQGIPRAPGVVFSIMSMGTEKSLC